MALRPPLTHEDLAKIRARYELMPDRPPCAYADRAVWKDILTLLYEIKRLRAMLLVADQLRDRFPNPGNCLDSVWEEFQRNLAAEPCVRELGEIKVELTDPTGSNRKRSGGARPARRQARAK